MACFERLGAPGWAALDEVADRARERGLLVIADAKRGDIDITAAAYAQAYFGETSTPFGPVAGLGADALTANPLLTAVDHDRSLRRWYVRMRGDDKAVITVWLTLGERTLHYETYFMPAPEENVRPFQNDCDRRRGKDQSCGGCCVRRCHRARSRRDRIARPARFPDGHRSRLPPPDG